MVKQGKITPAIIGSIGGFAIGLAASKLIGKKESQDVISVRVNNVENPVEMRLGDTLQINYSFTNTEFGDYVQLLITVGNSSTVVLANNLPLSGMLGPMQVTSADIMNLPPTQAVIFEYRLISIDGQMKRNLVYNILVLS